MVVFRGEVERSSGLPVMRSGRNRELEHRHGCYLAVERRKAQRTEGQEEVGKSELSECQFHRKWKRMISTALH